VRRRSPKRPDDGGLDTSLAVSEPLSPAAQVHRLYHLRLLSYLIFSSAAEAACCTKDAVALSAQCERERELEDPELPELPTQQDPELPPPPPPGRASLDDPGPTQEEHRFSCDAVAPAAGGAVTCMPPLYTSLGILHTKQTWRGGGGGGGGRGA
jgi:hypothetical protein